MKYLTISGADSRRLSFYLAAEEYVARHTNIADDLFFMWQVNPTVIFGRNQVMEAEVNIDYCRRHGIDVVRRKSGGGCVYADRGNIMLSCIMQGDNVAFNYNRFMGLILLVLREMGIEAVGTSHNDVLIDGLKVCGTAFYQLPGRSIAHSTLLYDTNMEHMLNAITPPPEKLQKRGIQSVRQRITLLRHHTTLTLDEVKAYIRSTVCDGDYPLSPSDVAAIEDIEHDGYPLLLT